MTTVDVTAPRRPGVLATLRGLQARYPLAQVAVLAVVFAYGAITIDGFDSRRSIYSMLVLAALLGVATVGQTLCILIAGIDFSIAAWIGAGAIMLVQLNGARGWSFGATFGLIAAVSLFGGGAVGYICHRWRIDPLIITLAMSGIVSGAILVWAKGFITGTPPTWLQNLTSPAGKTFGIEFPPLVAVWAVLAVVVAIVLSRTSVGRRIYATGANIRAADMALVRTRWVWVGVFATSAFFAAVTGILLGGFAGAADASLGNAYLWQGLTAVIVGGTAFGARGDYWRTVLGSLLLIVLGTVMVGKGYTTADQQILYGVLIFVVVFFYGRDPRLSDRV
ncbi:MAG TPA: ABC transporter permease [Gaiellaceae bacterium]|jgi:ribose transport system permease protein